MRQRIQALVVAVAAAAALNLQVHAAGVQNAQRTTIEISGAGAGSALELALNGGKIADGTPGADGSTTLVAGLGTETRQRVTVWVDRCKDGKIVRVQLAVEGQAEPPKDEDCDRKLAGWFWSNARRVRINVVAGTVRTSNLLRQRNLIIAGGAAAGAGLLMAGGNDSSNNSNNNPGSQTPGGSNQTPFNPAGNYQVTTARRTDPGEHFTFIQLMTSGVLTAGLSNVTMTITGPSGSNFVTVTGTYDSSTNRFVLTGSGTVAGRPNVGVRFEGTITTGGAISGDYTMGTGGELPGGQAIVYSVTGQRQ